MILPGDLRGQSVSDKDFKSYEGKTVTLITVTGNRVTKDFVISREIVVKIGEPLSIAELKKSVQNLNNLDIFSSIKVTGAEDEDGVSINITVREMPWIIPYLKFKYNEENGWSVGPTVSSLNLLGRGIKLSAFVLFGGTTTFSVIGSYPWITGNHVSLDLTAQHLIRDDKLNHFEENSDQFTPWLGTYIGDNGRLKGTVSWFRMDSDSSGRTLDPDNEDNFLSIGAEIGYDSRDSYNNPHHGWQNNLTIAKTGDPLPGNGDSWRFVFDVRRFQPTTKKQTLVLAGLASFNTGTVGVDYPEYLMYRMGGANSIRGYNLENLGQVLFGQNQLIFTFEYQFLVMPFREYVLWKWPVRAGLQAAAFADWGNAWNEGQDQKGRGKAGFGLGLRPLLPAINMLRFDFGYSKDEDLVFNFGIHSKMDAQTLRLR
jgi:outer membrane protein insertion porin family